MKKELLDLKNFKMVQKLCDVVLKNAEFFALLGETRSGKTVALMHFYNNNKERCKYIRVGEVMKTTDFFEELAKQYDYQGPRRNNYAFANYLKEYYRLIDENELLILDEGGRFKPYQYTILHEIRDLTMGKLGMILAGPEYFIKEMEKYSRKGIKGIPEFYRRIQLCVEMQPMTKKEVIAVCKYMKIDDAKVIQKKFLHFDNIGKLVTAIKNYKNYNGLFD